MTQPPSADVVPSGAMATQRTARLALRNWRVARQLIVLVAIPAVLILALTGLWVTHETRSAGAYGQVGRLASLGQQVTVSWTDGQLEAVCGTGSVPGVIAVTFQPGIPPGAAVGLLAGPGGCVFSVPPNVSTVTMALATQPSLCICFGTPPGSGGFSDLSAPLVLNPAGVSAAVCIGADNILLQTG